MHWRVTAGWKVRDREGILRKGGEEIDLPENELISFEERGIVNFNPEFDDYLIPEGGNSALGMNGEDGSTESDDDGKEEVTSDGAAVPESGGGLSGSEKPDGGTPAKGKTVAKKSRKPRS